MLLRWAMKNLTDLGENTPQMQFLINDAKYVTFFFYPRYFGSQLLYGELAGR